MKPSEFLQFLISKGAIILNMTISFGEPKPDGGCDYTLEAAWISDQGFDGSAEFDGWTDKPEQEQMHCEKIFNSQKSR